MGIRFKGQTILCQKCNQQHRNTDPCSIAPTSDNDKNSTTAPPETADPSLESAEKGASDTTIPPAAASVTPAQKRPSADQPTSPTSKKRPTSTSTENSTTQPPTTADPSLESDRGGASPTQHPPTGRQSTMPKTDPPYDHHSAQKSTLIINISTPNQPPTTPDPSLESAEGPPPSQTYPPVQPTFRQKPTSTASTTCGSTTQTSNISQRSSKRPPATADPSLESVKGGASNVTQATAQPTLNKKPTSTATTNTIQNKQQTINPNKLDNKETKNNEMTLKTPHENFPDREDEPTRNAYIYDEVITWLERKYKTDPRASAVMQTLWQNQQKWENFKTTNLHYWTHEPLDEDHDQEEARQFYLAHQYYLCDYYPDIPLVAEGFTPTFDSKNYAFVEVPKHQYLAAKERHNRHLCKK